MHQPVFRHVAAASAFKSCIIIGAPLHLQLFQFVSADSLFPHFANHSIESGESFFARVFRLVHNPGCHLRRPVVAEQVIDASLDVNGNLLFLHQYAVDSASPPTVQRLIQQRHSAPVRRATLRHQIADGHRRQRAKLFYHVAASFFGLFRLGGIREGRRPSGGNAAEMLFGQRHAFPILTSPRRRSTALFGT